MTVNKISKYIKIASNNHEQGNTWENVQLIDHWLFKKKKT